MTNNNTKADKQTQTPHCAFRPILARLSKPQTDKHHGQNTTTHPHILFFLRETASWVSCNQRPRNAVWSWPGWVRCLCAVGFDCLIRMSRSACRPQPFLSNCTFSGCVFLNRVCCMHVHSGNCGSMRSNHVMKQHVSRLLMHSLPIVRLHPHRVSPTKLTHWRVDRFGARDFVARARFCKFAHCWPSSPP